MLYHQKIPSVTIKLIRSFIDIPSHEIEEGEHEADDESDHFSSVSDIAGILADILKNLIHKPQALRRFIMEDNLFVLLRAFLTKPAMVAESDSEAPSDMSEDLPQYDLVWKRKYVHP